METERREAFFRSSLNAPSCEVLGKDENEQNLRRERGKKKSVGHRKGKISARLLFKKDNPH